MPGVRIVIIMFDKTTKKRKNYHNQSESFRNRIMCLEHSSCFVSIKDFNVCITDSNVCIPDSSVCIRNLDLTL